MSDYAQMMERVRRLEAEVAIFREHLADHLPDMLLAIETKLHPAPAVEPAEEPAA